MNKSWIRLLYLTIVFVINACEGSDKFTMGDELVNVNSNVIFVDTSTVRFYTMIRDSVITSGTQIALVGKYTDGNFGTITARTYFEVNPTSSSIGDFSSEYDSIKLVFNYSHYSYGDTTKPFVVKVHKITKNLEDNLNDNGYRYNNSQVEFDTNPIGTKRFRPHPANHDGLEMRLSDEIGLDFFNLLINQSSIISNVSDFVKHFKGIVLTGEDPANSAILGFHVADTSIYIRLYYHSIDVNSIDVNYYLDFPVTNYDLQFNHIEANRNGSPLNVLRNEEDVISSINTNHEAYSQAVTGVTTKLEFPYLKKLIENGERIKILKAELILSPVKNTYRTVSLPQSLLLYQTNELNQIGNALVSSDGYAIAPILTIDDLYNEQTNYVFDITYFIAAAINQKTDDIPSLGVSLAQDQYNTTLNRVVFGDQSRDINVSKLKIMYWRY